MNVLANDAVCLRCSPRDVAGNLRVVMCHSLGAKTEGRGIVVSRLLRETRPIDGAPIEARRRSGLEPASAQAEVLQRLSEQNRIRFPRTSRRILLLSTVNQTIEKGAGCDDHSLGAHGAAVAKANSKNAASGIRCVAVVFDGSSGSREPGAGGRFHNQLRHFGLLDL